MPPRSYAAWHVGLRDERDLSVMSRLGCGAFAGTFGQTVAYPFDVARRRLQVSVGLWPMVRRGEGVLRGRHLMVPPSHLISVGNVIPPAFTCLLPALCPQQVSGWQGAKQLHAAAHGEAYVYTGMMDCFVRTVREEGFRALFKV